MLAQKYATPLEVISLEHIEENYNFGKADKIRL